MTTTMVGAGRLPRRLWQRLPGRQWKRLPWRQWTPAFVGFFLIFAAWGFAAPFDGPPDEVQHVVRAVGVVSGQIAPKPAIVLDGQGHPGMGAVQQVPIGLGQHATCWGFNPKASAACAPPLHGGPVGNVPTSAGRYNPLYYALVGWPLKFAPDWTGLVLARLLSAAWSALLVACAFVVLIRWSRFGLMIGALVLSASPMLAHLAGAVNPNGIEIAAGIAFFSAGIPLLLGPRRGNTKPLWWLLGTSGVVLGTVRSLGPVWLALGLALLLTPTSRRAVARLWADRLARGWLLALGAALVLSVAWILIMGTGQIAPAAKPGHLSLIHATYQYLDNWTTYLYGMVGVAGWFDIRLSVPFYWAYVGAAATLVVLGLIAGGWANRWRFFLVLVGGLIIPGVLQVSEVNQVGFIIGGRYMLPLVVAMPLLGAFITERRVVTDRQARSLTKLCCLIAMPTQLALLLWAMMRWQKGLNGLNLNPLTGQWHPPSGSALPVLLMLAGIAVVWWISIRSVHESLTYADLDPASPDSRAVTPGRSWSLVEADPSIDAASTNGSVVSSTGGSARSPAHGDGQQ